jgi:hypothetical protein
VQTISTALKEYHSGLAILSALVTLFFIKPLTQDGMVREDRAVRTSCVETFIFIDKDVCSSVNILRPMDMTHLKWAWEEGKAIVWGVSREYP